ncbi:LCP family protein [Bacillus sp. V3B]|uniref:LCP family protein n=1 Tax=Bacillus sp. V3B TaxID=2804915 RepID=UPI00210C362E|nr:LCP family protein [Bacillus sp. V3B]MCQ6274377.1 LCP family protein [Bacillus sp. V3B]
MRYEKHQHEKKLKKKRKKRKLKNVVLLLFFFMLVTFGYAYFQYQQGIKHSQEQASFEQENYEFNGEKDRYGGINILLIGSDSRGEESARSDTIMIAQYHPDKHSYKLISIMRDTYVDIPKHGKNKINAAFALGGPELLRQTIKENFDVDTKYYAIIDFDGFVHLIDEAFPNGVKIDVEKAMSAYIGVKLEPGLQRLDGKHLLGYVRFRHDAMGDFDRVKRQQKAMKEVADQFASLQTLSKLPKLVGVMKPFVNTNMDTSDIIYIGKDYLSKNNRDISTLRVPIDGEFEPQRISHIGEVLRLDLGAHKEAIGDFLAE